MPEKYGIPHASDLQQIFNFKPDKNPEMWKSILRVKSCWLQQCSLEVSNACVLAISTKVDSFADRFVLAVVKRLLFRE